MLSEVWTFAKDLLPKLGGFPLVAVSIVLLGWQKTWPWAAQVLAFRDSNVVLLIVMGIVGIAMLLSWGSPFVARATARHVARVKGAWVAQDFFEIVEKLKPGEVRMLQRLALHGRSLTLDPDETSDAETKAIDGLIALGLVDLGHTFTGCYVVSIRGRYREALKYYREAIHKSHLQHRVP